MCLRPSKLHSKVSKFLKDPTSFPLTVIKNTSSARTCRRESFGNTPLGNSIGSLSLYAFILRHLRLVRHSIPCGISLSLVSKRSNLFSAMSFFNDGTSRNI
uniref:Uncharacterized protein n=1 Tax=Salix viminalis TaxID=40686 RepID=A0A6N2LH04_SALVM